MLAAFYLSEIIRRNKLADHWVIPVALSSRQTASNFYSGGPADVSATISLHFGELPDHEIERLVANRRDNIRLLFDFFSDRGYRMAFWPERNPFGRWFGFGACARCAGEMNFLALAR